MIYLYRRRDNGEIVQRHFDHLPDDEEKLRRITCEDGTIADRDFTAEAQDSVGHKAYGGLWPKKSRAMGLNPNQITEDGKYGDPTMRKRFPDHQFDPNTGEQIFNSMKQRRKQLSDVGFKDNDSFMH